MVGKIRLFTLLEEFLEQHVLLAERTSLQTDDPQQRSCAITNVEILYFDKRG